MPETRQVRGCCPLDCQDSCSWLADVVDGRVTRVTGAKEHPFTRGSLCAKVNDYQERTYAPDRLLYPLRRTGAKGSGEFERVSWELALETIAMRFGEVIAEDGAEALLPLNYLGSMGVLQRRALMRLFHVLGASRFHGSICGAAGNMLDVEGHPRGFDPETIADSRFILLWGANLLTTSHHHFHFIREARRRHGARIVCIDPRRTMTAKACDEHISIRPGSDSVMAAGLAHVMLDEGLADLEFAGRVANDLQAFREQVQHWTPERVSAVCGLPAAVVIRLAREFGTARPATIRCGVAPQQTVHGDSFVRNLAALAILGGHWRHPGGGLFMETSPNLDEMQASRPDLMTGSPRSLDLAALGEHLTSAELDPPLKGLMIWTMNPAIDQPNVQLVRAGLAREDLFTVVIENFMTDTARYADFVLPSTTQLEHFDLQGAWGHHYISVNNPAIAPLGESKPHAEIMRLLARRMGLTHAALSESDEQIAAATLPMDVSLEVLKNAGWVKSTPSPPDFDAAKGRLKLTGGVPLPVDPPLAGSLQLLTPKSLYFMNSSFGNMQRQRQLMQRPTLEMNRADAERRGLQDQQEVVLRNDRGSLRVWLCVTEDIHEGVVALPGKWWSLPEGTGAVANLLTPSSWSPGGQPAYNDTFVEVLAALQEE
jgi:anaerobic selenocysteine-containing dehydrogenase